MTLKITTTQVVETSATVNNNNDSFMADYGNLVNLFFPSKIFI